MERMNKEFKEELFNQLKETGFLDRELGEFDAVLNKLSSVSKIERSFTVKRKFLEGEIQPVFAGKPFWSKWFFAPVITFALLILISTATVVKAQASFPGELLYPVKRLSENAYVLVNPRFKNEMVIRRSQEVKKLIEENKGPVLLNKTINDYQKEVKDEDDHNQGKIEESRQVLEQAKENASGEDRKDIENALEENSQSKDVKSAGDKSGSEEKSGVSENKNTKNTQKESERESSENL